MSVEEAMKKTMRMFCISMLMVFLFLVCAAAQQPAPGLPGDRPVGSRQGAPQRGEVSGMAGDILTISLRDGTTETIKLSDQVRIGKEKKITAQDLQTGRYVRVFGQRGTDGTFKAVVVRMMEEDRPPAKRAEGRRETPVAGVISRLNPFQVSTDGGVVDVDLSGVRAIFLELPLKATDLKKGDKVLVIGRPGNPSRIVVVDLFPEEPADSRGSRGPGGAGQQQRDDGGR
jgi:hypothetical protein